MFGDGWLMTALKSFSEDFEDLCNFLLHIYIVKQDQMSICRCDRVNKHWDINPNSQYDPSSSWLDFKIVQSLTLKTEIQRLISFGQMVTRQYHRSLLEISFLSFVCSILSLVKHSQKSKVRTKLFRSPSW